MKTKEEIVQNWLPRYTGSSLEQFGEYVILVNFFEYVGRFAADRFHQQIMDRRPGG
jgi:AMP nucleosidase